MTALLFAGLAGGEVGIEAGAAAAFTAGLRGPALSPGQPEYEAARELYNGMFDRRPALIVRCTGVSDVMRAVNFARDHRVLLSVRGGGHNVAGYALCDGGLTIDLSHMRSVVVDPVARIARVEGGATWLEFDAETQAFGLATTGGLVSTTGVAGLTLGGGIGWLTRAHGLSCDNLIAVDIVTGTGEFLHASEDENAELLWGVRGGGGNFGVVTNLVFRLHPVGPIHGGLVVHPFATAGALFRFYRDHYDAAPPELGLDAALGISPDDGNPFAAFILVYNGPAEDGERACKPFREFGTPLMDTCGPTTYAAVQTQFDATVPSGIPNYWKSAFLEELADGAIDAMIEHFERAPTCHAQMLIEGVGGAMNRIARDATAFDHREAKFNFLTVAAWEDRARDEENISWARGAWGAVSKYASGVYANYLDEGQDKIEQAFGPGKYERLVRLKDRYDPMNLLRLNQNIKPSPS